MHFETSCSALRPNSAHRLWSSGPESAYSIGVPVSRPPCHQVFQVVCCKDYNDKKKKHPEQQKHYHHRVPIKVTLRQQLHAQAGKNDKQKELQQEQREERGPYKLPEPDRPAPRIRPESRLLPQPRERHEHHKDEKIDRRTENKPVRTGQRTVSDRGSTHLHKILATGTILIKVLTNLPLLINPRLHRRPVYWDRQPRIGPAAAYDLPVSQDYILTQGAS